MHHSATLQLNRDTIFLKYLPCYVQQFNCLYTCAVTLCFIFKLSSVGYYAHKWKSYLTQQSHPVTNMFFDTADKEPFCSK